MGRKHLSSYIGYIELSLLGVYCDPTTVTVIIDGNTVLVQQVISLLKLGDELRPWAYKATGDYEIWAVAKDK